MSHDILVTNPIEHSVTVNKVFRNCPITVHDREFSADLIELSFHEFDVILDMDWLAKHQAVVDCKFKRVVLKASNNSDVVVYGERQNLLSNVISAITARKLIRKGCEVF